MTELAWLDEIPLRRMLEPGLETHVALPPGDRPLVEPGGVVQPGDPLLEHVRDRRIEEVEIPAGKADGPSAGDAAGSARGADRPPAGGADSPSSGAGDRLQAGSRWTSIPGRRRRQEEQVDGELLAPVPGHRGRWRLVTGDHRVLVASPVGGVVTGVRPGAEIRLRVDGLALRGAFATGASARGRLELATDPFGDLRPGGIDVGRTGSILVVGSRIDAEALTRARAMGVHGIVVASLAGKDLRDFQASERRQRAALHPAQPFGVLALDGSLRRPIAAPVMDLFERLAGRDVALLVDPPALVFDAEGLDLPDVPPDWVRVRSGPNAGSEGRVLGLVGLRRFAAGVHLETARVILDGEPAIDVPLGDLERLA